MRSALLLLGLLARCVTGYQVLVTDQDEVRSLFRSPLPTRIATTDSRSSTRSGRSAAGCGARERRIRSSRVCTPPPLLREPRKEPHNVRFPPAVLFSPSSRGQAALVVYEWQDAKYLGVGADGQQGDNDWSEDVRAFFSAELSPGKLIPFPCSACTSAPSMHSRKASARPISSANSSPRPLHPPNRPSTPRQSASIPPRPAMRLRRTRVEGHIVTRCRRPDTTASASSPSRSKARRTTRRL